LFSSARTNLRHPGNPPLPLTTISSRGDITPLTIGFFYVIIPSQHTPLLVLSIFNFE